MGECDCDYAYYHYGDADAGGGGDGSCRVDTYLVPLVSGESKLQASKKPFPAVRFEFFAIQIYSHHQKRMLVSPTNQLTNQPT